MRARSTLVLALVLGAGTLWSQDSHYWTEQFGNRARLLGGAVIGGGSDIAVVYYNPGALALMANPEILLFGNVFEARSVSADPVSPGVDGASSTSFSLSPSLFAGRFAVGSAETTLDLKPSDFESGMVDTSYLRATFIVGFNFALATGG